MSYMSSSHSYSWEGKLSFIISNVAPFGVAGMLEMFDIIFPMSFSALCSDGRREGGGRRTEICWVHVVGDQPVVASCKFGAFHTLW